MSAFKLFVEALKWAPIIRLTVKELVQAMQIGDERRVTASIEALRRAAFVHRNTRGGK